MTDTPSESAEDAERIIPDDDPILNDGDMGSYDQEFELAYLLKTLEALEGDQSGTLESLARRMRLLQRIQQLVKTMTSDLEMILDERMPADSNYLYVSEVGWLHRKPTASTAGSNWKGIRNDAKRAVATKMSIDPETGEIIQSRYQLVRSALDLLEACISLGSPKSGYESILHLDRDDHIVTSFRNVVEVVQEP